MVQTKSNLFTASKLLGITKSPGAQYILVNANETIEECNTGYADIPAGTPVTAGTTFNNFSVTKTATAAAILQLAEQEKIRLTDFVNPMFNEFHFEHPFTIEQLVAHQSGLGDPVPISWIHQTEEEKSFDENAFIRRTVDKYSKQHFMPGAKFSYSSIGYLLLEQIIEKVSGEPYASYVTNHVLAKSTGNDVPGFTIKDESLHATGYHPRFSFSNLLLGVFLDRNKYIRYSRGAWTAFNNFYVNGKAYGGFIGNVRGLGSYLQSYLSGKIFEDPETRQHMFTEQKGGMAFGWFTGMLNGERYVCHAGGGGGYYCEIRIYPERKMASALLRNRSSFRDLRMLDKIDANYII